MTEKSSTDLVEAAGTELTRFNAVKHGILSRYTVLPWEDDDAYGRLLGALADEHQPNGPTEEHLVEELAGILWRKRRLRLAEAAAHRRGLLDRSDSYRTVEAALVHLGASGKTEKAIDAINASAEDTECDIADVAEDEAMTRRAEDILKSRRNDAYEAALEEFREDTREWWAAVLAGDPDELENDQESYEANADSLKRFLEKRVFPWLDNRRMELENRPLVREQAFGEAFDPGRLERLGRYEVHLDRKLERTLTMLVRLKELRGDAGV